MAVDSQGNAYIASAIKGEHASPAGQFWDMLLTKFDPSGNELWSQLIVTDGYDEGRSVIVDDEDNVYLTGHSSDSLGGPNAGSNDAVLIKFTPVTGDLNGDDYVGLDDLQLILNNWNNTVPTHVPSVDLDNDGFIGLNDLDVILTRWNTSLPNHSPTSIPEPATAALLITIGLGLLPHR